MAVLAGSGCGGGQTASSAQSEQGQVKVFPPGKGGHFATVRVPPHAQPHLKPPTKPPPEKVLTRDLVVGSGPAVRLGDRVSMYYYSVNYKTGKRAYYRWPPQPALVNTLTKEPWQAALVGMKPGGLREVIVPSHLLFHAGTYDYVFKMLGIKGKS